MRAGASVPAKCRRLSLLNNSRSSPSEGNRSGQGPNKSPCVAGTAYGAPVGCGTDFLDRWVAHGLPCSFRPMSDERYWRTRRVRRQVHDIGRRPSAVQCFQLNPQLGGDGAPAPVLALEPITPEKQDNFRCTFSEPQPGHGGACCRAADRISSSKSCPQALQRYS